MERFDDGWVISGLSIPAPGIIMLIDEQFQIPWGVRGVFYFEPTFTCYGILISLQLMSGRIFSIRKLYACLMQQRKTAAAAAVAHLAAARRQEEDDGTLGFYSYTQHAFLIYFNNHGERAYTVLFFYVTLWLFPADMYAGSACVSGISHIPAGLDKEKHNVRY